MLVYICEQPPESQSGLNAMRARAMPNPAAAEPEG